MTIKTIQLGIALGEDFIKEVYSEPEWYKPVIVETVLQSGYVSEEAHGTLFVRKVVVNDFISNTTRIVPNLYFRTDGKHTIENMWGLCEETQENESRSI